MNNYIDSAEPVGSRTLSKRVNGKWSSATIRNVMADLEEQGFLYKPHVVAGRIPTGKAFRYYVNTLLVPGLPGKREMHDPRKGSPPIAIRRSKRSWATLHACLPTSASTRA